MKSEINVIFAINKNAKIIRKYKIVTNPQQDKIQSIPRKNNSISINKLRPFRQ